MNYSAVLQFMGCRLGIYLCRGYLHTPKPFDAARGNTYYIFNVSYKTRVIHVRRIWKIWHLENLDYL